MAQAMLTINQVIIEEENIKQEPIDVSAVTCQHCRKVTIVWIQSENNTSPYTCNECSFKDDINIQKKETETSHKKSITSTANNSPHLSIHWCSNCFGVGRISSTIKQ